MQSSRVLGVNTPLFIALSCRQREEEEEEMNGQKHSRVVDDLEAVALGEREVVRRPRLVVVQRHEEGHAPWKWAGGVRVHRVHRDDRKCKIGESWPSL